MNKVIKLKNGIPFGQFHRVFKEVLENQYGVEAEKQRANARVNKASVSQADLVRMDSDIADFLSKDPFWSYFSYVRSNGKEKLKDAERVFYYLVMSSVRISLITSLRSRYSHCLPVPESIKIESILVEIPVDDRASRILFLTDFFENVIDKVRVALDV